MNIKHPSDCVVPGVDLAFAKQEWLRVHQDSLDSRVHSRIFFYAEDRAAGIPEEYSRWDLMTLETHMHKRNRRTFETWQDTAKLRGN
jgi:hypothetical protein